MVSKKKYTLTGIFDEYGYLVAVPNKPNQTRRYIRSSVLRRCGVDHCPMGVKMTVGIHFRNDIPSIGETVGNLAELCDIEILYIKHIGS